jgi:hypothetical protein
MQRVSRVRRRLTLALVSGGWAWLSSCVIACGPATDARSEPGGVGESCQADVMNEEWNIDCSAACNHVSACKASTGDSDLETLTCADCLGSCVAGVSLGGNDLVEGTEEDRRSWQCAALVEGCSALDHNCDLY